MRVVLDDGSAIDLGATGTTPTVGIIDYSRRVTDDFGVTTVVERGFARTMSVRLAVPFELADEAQRNLARLRSTPAMWVADDRFASLAFRGFYKDFSIDVAMPPLSYCTLTVEGLADGEAFVDPGLDPAPAGLPSTLQLIQPIDVTDAVLAASDMAENDHPQWASGVTYAAGARVILPATHRIYESLVDGNVGANPAASSGKWLDVAPTNRWAMFDQALGSATVSGAGIDVTLNAGAATALALLDVVGTAVRVRVGGYDRTMAVGPGATTFLDLPGTGAPIRVTIDGNGGVAVGTLLVGRLVSLGVTEAGPTASINDYSRKEIDDFGEVTVVQRAWSKKMAAKALIDTAALDVVFNRVAAVRARPSLWIGQSGIDCLTIYGFFKDFSIEVGETVSKLSLSIEGLSQAAKLAPLGTAVNWGDIADPDGTKPQNGADVTAEHEAKDTKAVGGRPAQQIVDAVDQIGPIKTRQDKIASDVSAIRDAQQDPKTGLDALNEAIRDGISALEQVNVGTHAALDALYRADADQVASLRQADRDRLDLTAALATALSEADRTRGLFRDAGFYKDAATGKVGMYAVDQQGEQLARTEITLEAQAALITTKASFNQVNEAIALAVLDPVQAAELRPLIARLTSAEQVLDGLNAAIRQTASLAQLNAVAGRMTTAEQGLDAVRGAVSTKVERSDFDLLGAKVGGVEETLESLGDVSRYAIDIRQGRTDYVDGAASSIASLILGDQNKRQMIVAQATARQEMFAKVDDARAAEAGARAVLTIQIADLDARSVQETKLRIAGEDLLGQRIDALGIANADQSAEIATLTEATIAGKVGLAGITTTVRQQGAAGFGDTVAAIADLVASDQAGRRRDGQIAQFQSDVSTRFVANEVAAAMAQQALLARMGGFDAALVTTLKVVADNDKAAGSRLFALETALANPVTGLPATRVRINAVEEASATRDEALGERINSVEAVIFAPDTGLPAALALITRNEAARVGMDNVLAEDIAALGVVQQGQAATIANLAKASIENGVGIAGVTTTIRQAIDDGTDSAFTALANLVAGDQAGQRFYRQLAEYQADTTTTLIANESAAVVARQAMLVRMAGFEAALVTTNKVIADTEKSLVSRIVAAEAVFNNPTTGLPATRSRLIAFEESTATAIEAQVERMDLMDATLLDPRTGKTLTGASVARDVKIAADANASRITDIEQLRGEVFDPESGLPAVSGRIDHERELSLARDNGLGIEISEIAVEIHDPLTGLPAATAGVAELRQAQVDETAARAEAIRQVKARLDGVGGVGVEQSIGAVVDRLGKIEGRYALIIDANGNWSGFEAIGSDKGPGTFNFINMDLRMGTGRIILNTGSYMVVQGIGFGAEGVLLEWYGPTMEIAKCSITNAISYKTTDGRAVFRGSNGNAPDPLSITSNQVGQNQLTSPPWSKLAQFDRINASFNWSNSGGRNETIPGTVQSPEVTIVLFRKLGEGAEEEVARATATGYFSALGTSPDFFEQGVSATLNYIDADASTEKRVWRLAAALGYVAVPGNTPRPDDAAQQMTITATPQ